MVCAESIAWEPTDNTVGSSATNDVGCGAAWSCTFCF